MPIDTDGYRAFPALMRERCRRYLPAAGDSHTVDSVDDRLIAVGHFIVAGLALAPA